jgi:hypothetical protein
VEGHIISLDQVENRITEFEGKLEIKEKTKKNS